MKAKFRFLYGAIILLLAVFTVGVCALSSVGKKMEVAKAVGSGTNEYSFIDDFSGVIFSVEKVAVRANENLTALDFSNDNFITPLYENDNEESATKKMLVRDTSPENGLDAVYFKDIPNGTKNPNKYVVYDGEFVMLNNLWRGTGKDRYAYSPDQTAFVKNETGFQKENLSEAVLVSFGQYFRYYTSSGTGEDVQYGLAGQTEYRDAHNNNQEVEAENSGANIEFLSVSAMKDGNSRPLSLPGLRMYSDSYVDFAWIIPQVDGNEGYYTITVTYRHSGQVSQLNFSFYLLFGTSYYSNITDNNGISYSSQPTISNTTNDTGMNRFYIGKDDVDMEKNYPTLTYDFSKYTVAYDHIANGVTTRYSYRMQLNSAGNRAQLVMTVNGQDANTFEMGEYNRNGANIAVLVFTEVGEYNFSLEYRYDGYTPGTVPTMNLKLDNLHLFVHGYELKYAKTSTNEAQMRYVTFARPVISSQDKSYPLSVGLVVPNGYVKDSTFNPNTKLGVMFDTTQSSTRKVGDVEAMRTANISYSGEGGANPISDLLEGGDLNIEFIKSNFGALWLDANDNYTSTKKSEEGAITGGSLYYYGSTKAALIASSPLEYNNLTTFNKTGFYLVFIRVEPRGASDKAYYSVFAFEYSSDTVNVSVKEESDSPKEIGTGKFTNKDVRISWVQPDVFERGVNVYYYKSGENSYPTRQQLLQGTANEIPYDAAGVVLGSVGNSRVADGTGSSFLIEIKREGKASSYRTFIIDRQDISGVTAYAVDSGYNRQGNVVYSFLQNGALKGGITNTLATMFWNDKPSGAAIEATYTFTPFVRSTEAPSIVASTGASNIWTKTTYALGETIGEFDLSRAESTNSDLESTQVLFEQGIYYFTLKDEAGNSCRYLFVIDNSEAYFKINYTENGEAKSEFQTRTSLLYTDTVTVEVGTHKVIPLSLGGASQHAQDLAAAVQRIVIDPSGLEGYYGLSDTNLYALQNIFGRVQRTSGGGYDYYLTVKNNALYLYDDMQIPLASEGLQSIDASHQSVRVEARGSSNMRVLYLIGANQISTPPQQSNSFVSIEVNTDHSLGMAFYADSDTPLQNVGNLMNNGSGGATRLRYGDDGTKTKMQAAHATGANFLAFAWNMGMGTDYEIATVELNFYELDLTQNVEDRSEFLERYFYRTTPKKTTFYSTDSGFNQAVQNTDQDRVFVLLNVSRNQTGAGLYVITRSYKKNIEAEGEKDSTDLTYYFIVDRQEIIEEGGDGTNGGKISIGLKDNEETYSNFGVSGARTNSIIIQDGGAVRTLTYNVYLETNKLPAGLNIPVGKFFYSDLTHKTNGVNGTDYFGSEYYAGKLKFDVYFYDYYSQFSSLYSAGSSEPNNFYLFTSYSNVDLSGETMYYGLNFTQQLTGEWQSRLVKEGNDRSWICLPGDYIIVIKDNVEGGDAHEKVIGFRITSNYPTTDLFSTATNPREATINGSEFFANEENRLITSEDYVVLDMQNYEQSNRTLIQASLDLDYLTVSQTLNGQTDSNFIVYNHGSSDRSTHKIDSTDDEVVLLAQKENGITTHRKILLPTQFRNSNGEMELATDLQYEINIRFNVVGVSNPSQTEKYKDCYYYYDTDGSFHAYFSNSYTVVIDRTPPQMNVNALLASDKLASYYSSEMFETTRLDTGEFVTRYKDYYPELDSEQKDKASLYALHVNERTPFSFNNFISGTQVDTTNNVDRVLFREILDPAEAENAPFDLTLPVDFSRGYSQTGPVQSYAALFGTDYNKFYEIVEQDEARNSTQYIVYYTESNSQENLSLTLNSNRAIGGEETSGTIVLNAANNNADYTVFDLSLPAGNAFNNLTDYFYIIEISSYEEPILTNFETHFTNAGLANEIISAILNNGYGNYSIKFTSNFSTLSFTINYIEGIKTFDPQNLIRVEDGSRYIYLKGANVEDDGITYYVREITISKESDSITYYCDPSNDFNYYTIIEGNREYAVDNSIRELFGQKLTGSYIITMVDMFGKNDYYHEFNAQGLQPYDISFGADGNAGYARDTGDDNSKYYSYAQANVEYDALLYDYSVTYELLYNGNRIDSGLDEYIKLEVGAETNRNKLVILPYFGEDNAGAEFSITVTLNPKNTAGRSFSYYIMIDTTTSAVFLRTDDGHDVLKDMNLDVNVPDENLFDTASTSPYTGRHYLSWSPIRKGYFDYSYTLYERMDDGSVNELDLTEFTRASINTQRGSTGVYRFVVRVFTNNAAHVYLGNKVYTFTVQYNPNSMYVVRTVKDNRTLSANSQFKFADVNFAGYNNELGLNLAEIQAKTDDFDLFVSNEELYVQLSPNVGAELTSWRMLNTLNFTFTIYRIHASYNIFFGILQVNENNQIVSNLEMKMKNTSRSIDLTEGEDNRKFYGPDEEFTLVGTQLTAQSGIIRKNTVVLSVWCNGVFVGEMDMKNADDPDRTFAYQILGSGQFTIVFKDLAGNTHNFNANSEIDALGTVVEEVDLTVLNEVVLMVNGMNAIDGAYYNGQVEIRVFNSNMYDMGIEFSAKRNGKNYTSYKRGQYSYTFSDYGNYKIVVSGTPRNTGRALYKELVFSIVNPNEARESFDLTSIANYDIVRVTNGRDDPITDRLLDLMKASDQKNRYLLTYDFFYSNALGTGSGKQLITLTYQVNDHIYPLREITFSFTLFDAQPNIDCDLKPGDTTTKGFTIRYNAKMIYDQVGDSEIYVNDILVCKIDQNSSDADESYTVSFKTHGAGDFYVILQGSSGAVHNSFKITIKEPLNTWSIILIVVVVAIVLAIVGIIVFLRTRMKIR